jgi:hypothetical protein
MTTEFVVYKTNDVVVSGLTRLPLACSITTIGLFVCSIVIVDHFVDDATFDEPASSFTADAVFMSILRSYTQFDLQPTFE